MAKSSLQRFLSRGGAAGLSMVLAGCLVGSTTKLEEPVIAWDPGTYNAPRVGRGPVVDGVVDDSVWALAAWSDDFVDIMGADRPAPRYYTRMKMLWDSDYLYVAAEMEEPHVWGTLLDRDAIIYHDNDFEVFIDPDGDTHEYYELEVNALATAWDLMLLKPYRDGGPAIDSWDIQGLLVAVSVDGTINDPRDVDRGWSVEIALPWEVLGEAAHGAAPPVAGDRWRMNFSRVEWQTAIEGQDYVKLADPTTGDLPVEDNWVWSPQGLVNMHYPEMWGIVQFSDESIGDSPVLLSQADIARHTLYSIYYRQRDWFAGHDRYARSLSELGMLEVPVPGFSATPQITLGPSQFEAVFKGSGASVHIDQTGRSWIQ